MKRSLLTCRDATRTPALSGDAGLIHPPIFIQWESRLLCLRRDLSMGIAALVLTGRTPS